MRQKTCGLLVMVGLLSAIGVGGCNNNAEQQAAPTRFPIELREQEWASKREALLADATAKISAGAFTDALVLLQPFASVHDPELKAVMQSAELGQLREEAGTLKPDDLEQRRRVYENITRLDPTDAEAAEQHERVIAEIGKVSSLSDRKLCAKLHSDNANIVYLQEY